jgi:hypothetical protein
MSSSGTIDLPSHPQFQRWEWRIQRVAWCIGIVLLLAAAMGFLGPGLASSRKRSNEEGSLTLQFDRFARHHSPGVIDAEISIAQPRFELEVSTSFLREVQVVRIEPPPLQTKLGDEGAVYVFEKISGAAAVHVQFHVNYEHCGEAEGFVQLLNHKPVKLTQFVYP